MKKFIANKLRELAAMLDPPICITVSVGPVQLSQIRAEVERTILEAI